MKIGIDIDDTITNTCEFMTEYVSSYFGVTKEYLTQNNIYYFNLPLEFKDKEKDFYLFIFESKLLNIPVKENAKEVINKLKEEGNEIIIITARENDVYNNPFISTKEQLEYYGINYDKLICTKEKRKACVEENIDVFIDDSMRNVNSVKDVVKNVYLFTSPYNKKFYVSFKRIDNWIQFYELLKRN